jgi:divalent metal cation (Fe/Co/Zn/Cd) transporter
MPLILYVVSLLVGLAWFVALLANMLFTSSMLPPWLIIASAVGVVISKLWMAQADRAETRRG